VTERLLLAQYLLAQYLREQAHWRLDAVDGNPMRAAHCVLALIDAAAYIRELPGDDPCVAALAVAGCFASGSFEPGTETRDFIRRWQFEERPSAGPRDLLGALAARCASTRHAALAPPQPRAPADGRGRQPAAGRDGYAPQQIAPSGDGGQARPRAPVEGRRGALAAARSISARRGSRRKG
jgi:hypothetical protein